ncbi:MAG: CxxxxCH/CxxCH domain-containing protein [Geobacteraceae bacterium]|nr:CxxxxCH/CxxCH domain-containing protein [Geobacteraceae bacterium]
MGKQLVNNIRGMNPLARRGTLLLLALLVSFSCLTLPRSADAAVAALQNWRNTAGTSVTGTAYFRGTTALPTATNAFGAVPAGSNRLMVVALVVNTATAVAGPVPTIQFGAQTLSLATSDQASLTRQHTYLYYLKEAQIAAAVGTNLSFTFTGGSTYTGTYANAAVYSGVDQGTPFQTPLPSTYSNAGTAGTVVGPITPSLVIATGDYAIEVIDGLRTGIATAPTITLQTGWTARGNTTRTGGTGAAAYGARLEVAYRNTAGTYTSQHTSNASTLNSMTALVIKQLAMPGITTGVTPPPLDVYAGDANKVVDAFTVTGGGTLTGITITGNAYTTPANISKVSIYKKGDANTTVYSGSPTDTLIGSVSNPTFPVTVPVSETIVANTNYIITYDINPAAIGNGTAVKLTGNITGITPTGGTVSDTAATSATLTLMVSTVIGNGTEPAAARVKNSSAPTLMDAFTVSHTGTSPTDDDTITSVTATLAPQYISGGTAATLSKIKKVEIIKCSSLEPDGYSCSVANTTSYGSMPSALAGDTWDIPLTTAIPVTSSPATYYIRISTADNIIPSLNDTSGTATGYYGVSGKITGLMHSKSNNKLVLGDTGSQTVAIDFENPNNVPAFNALPAQTTDTDGTLNLTWTAASDPNGGSLNVATPYKVMRSAPSGGYPNPYCIDGTDIGVAGNVLAFTDSGLVSTQATKYKYRICTVDLLGNISQGLTAAGTAKVHSVCGNLPLVKLVPDSQIIKSTGTPYGLQVSNMDTGVCPDVTYDIAIVSETASQNVTDFTKTFSPTVTLGTGGAGHASTGTSVPITISSVGTKQQLDARQLENYSFKVTVTAPGYNGGAPIYANYQTTPTINPNIGAAVSGVLNDMPPIVHNSANMGKFSYGGWGQTYTCATCHSNSTTNIKGIFQQISTPIGRRNVVFNATSGSTGAYGNDQRAVKNGSTMVCSVCHHKTRQHQYSANKPFGGPTNSDTYQSNHNNSRDCINCHTHNTAFRSITGVCGDCHGTSVSFFPVDNDTMAKPATNAMGPLPSNYGAHKRHDAIQVGCAACHSNTNHGAATSGWLGNNFLEMGFLINKDTFAGFNTDPSASVTGGTFWGTTNLNFPLAWTGGPGTTINTTNDYNNSCVTYCHGNWPGNANQGAQQEPIWGGDGNEIVCGSCHYATGTTPPQGGSHLKHASTTGAGLGIACTKCHGTYKSYTGAAHINGKVEWSMATYTSFGTSATYNGSNAGATTGMADSTKTYGQCTNLYCHSDVRNITQAANGVGGPQNYKFATWGGTAPCGSCHALPNASGSHLNHENAEVAFDCHVCHRNGGTTTPGNHANGYVDFEFNGLAQNTAYSKGTKVKVGTAFGVCNNSDCHGRFQRAWGTAPSGLPLCEKCHGSATSTGGFYGTKGPGSSAYANESGVGTHSIHIQNLNAPRKTAFARFTSYAAPFSCNQCHYVPTGPFSPGHIDSALPAESTFAHVSSISHNGDTFGYYSTPTFNAATKTCNNIWCHGAGMNSNRGQGSYVGLAPANRIVPKWNQEFLTGNGNADCTSCHAMPPLGATSQHLGGVTLAMCKDCHNHVGGDGLSFSNKKLHVNGKIDGGCGGCHGNPPISSTIGTVDGLATPAQNALTSGQAGAHNAHQLLPQISSNCNTCHNGYTRAMPSNTLEIGFNGLGGAVTTGTFTGYTNSVNGPHWSATSAGTTLAKSNVKGVTCSNLYCHGGGTGNGSGSDSNNLKPIGGGANTTPNWEGAVVCGDCHGTDNANAPTGGSHQRHAIKVMAVGCQSCHGVVPDNGTHIKGGISWQLDRTSPVFGPNAAYNGMSSGTIMGLVPRNNGTDYRTCSQIYCHSDVQGKTGLGQGLPNNYATPQWGKSSDVYCGSCHKNFAVEPVGTSTGSHFKHANTTSGMNVPCGYCHQDGGDGFDNMHADGNVFVNFTSYIQLQPNSYSVGSVYLTGKLKPSGSAAFGSCSNTFCHGVKSSPQWGNGTTQCNSCHSASTKASDVSWSGRHATHYNYTSLPTVYTDTVRDISDTNSYRFNCAHCHDDNVAKHSLKPASANSAARVFYGISSATPATSSKRGIYSYGGTANSKNDNGFKFTAGSCNTSYCHSDGKGGAPKITFLNWTTTPVAAGQNCLFCHDGKKSTTVPAKRSTLSGKHDAHMNYSSNQFMGRGNGYNCVDCHAQVISNTNNITLANKKLHVNAAVNYSGAKANKGLDTSAGKNGNCNSVYCHSNGNPRAIVYVNMTASKNWNSSYTITTCNQCHGRSNALGYPDYVNGGANSPTSNLHQGHLAGMADTTACADCHRKTGDALTANRFRPISTAHLNSGLDLVFNKTKAYVGPNAAAVQNVNQVTCSNVICHGQAQPVWGGAKSANSGAAGVRSCTKCHGTTTTADYLTNYSSAMIAPGYNNEGTDTSMVNSAATSARVGAHQRHLVSNVISAPVKCGECHLPVTNMSSGSHWNYSTATLSFRGARATITTPTVGRVGGIFQCSNVYCHNGQSKTGSMASPFWNITGIVRESGNTVGECIKCHAMPPQTGTHLSIGVKTLSNISSIAKVSTSCKTCHYNVLAAPTSVSNVFTDKNLHVNGSVEVTMSCNSCHSYLPTDSWTSNYGANNQGVGAHIKHINYLLARNPGVTMNASGDTFGGATFNVICGVCHTTDSAQHTTATPGNPRSIVFGTASTSRQFGTLHAKYNGQSGTSSSVNPKSCSNTDCHYRTSPIWSTY